MNSPGFHDLVRKAQAGDREAMDKVLDLLHTHLEYLARPFADPSRPAESTSDLLQDSCLRAWQKLGSFKGGKNDEETFAMFRAWIGTIVRRLGINARRDGSRQRRRPPNKILHLGSPPPGKTPSTISKLDAPSPDPTPSANVRVDERSRKIEVALESLSDPMDTAIVRMRFYDGLTLVQVSERLGVGYEQVKERYRAAIRRLEGDLQGLLE